MNHTCFSKECRDNKVTKGDRVEKFCCNISGVGSEWNLSAPSKNFSTRNMVWHWRCFFVLNFSVPVLYPHGSKLAALVFSMGRLTTLWFFLIEPRAWYMIKYITVPLYESSLSKRTSMSCSELLIACNSGSLNTGWHLFSLLHSNLLAKPAVCPFLWI